MKQIITVEEYFGSNPYNDELLRAADDLVLKVNSLMQEMGIVSLKITSGYRPPEYNKSIGGAPSSLHCTGEAVDLEDNNRVLGNRLSGIDVERLRSRGMAMENLAYCVRANGSKWVHLQTKLPKSGNTIFIPYSGIPKIT